MRAFNKRRYKGVKRYKSYTHLEIGYENCEYWTIPLKFVKIKMSSGIVESIEINIERVELNEWGYQTPELRLIRLTEYANDITSIKLIRVSKNRNYNSWVNEPSCVLAMGNYLESNPYSCYTDNLLQSTNFDGNTLTYSWILDNNINIIHPYNWYKGYIEIPRKYVEIIDKLDREVWDVKKV